MLFPTMDIVMVRMLLLSSFVGYVSAQVNCTGLADGNYELTCTSFGTCTGGVSSNTLECQGETVFNKLNGQCDDPSNVIPPCGTLLDCSITPDGYYADKTQGCTSWFTCHDRNYKGHTACFPGMVFDETLSTCNHKSNVAPPCGTKIGF
ncbi:peritrophin-48-like [Ruditapes philippinarum]|uniref:peritrophin-48-like n=1 Tax=Ruditapes philippinarum TaxID=129788 RepID=UPI00295A67E6|nr:peritrophin-48-like [Ruditapes philippinarum]